MALFRKAAALAPAGHPDHPSRLSNLGLALQTLFLATADAAVLQEAVDCARQSVAHTDAGDADRPDHLSNLGMALRYVYEWGGRPEAIIEALGCFREAAALTPAPDDARAGRLVNLMGSLLAAYEVTDDPRLNEEGLEVGREALAIAARGSAERIQCRVNYGLALQAAATRSDRDDLLDDAIAQFRAAWDDAAANDPSRLLALGNLANALQDRYTRTGNLAALHEAVDHGRKALTVAAPDSVERFAVAANLGIALHGLFRHTRRLKTLDEAIAMHRAAANAVTSAHLKHARVLNNLNISLQDLYEVTDRIEVLYEAIAVGRSAVRGQGDPPARSGSLLSLGQGLLTLYQHTGRKAALDEALELFRSSAAAVPRQAPDRVAQIDSLANALRELSLWSENPELLTEAVDLSRETLEACPEGDPTRPTLLNSLAMSLLVAHATDDQVAPLAEAAARIREAIAATAEGTAEHGEFMNNLGLVLQRLFARTDDPAVLREAAAVGEAALAQTPGGSPTSAIAANNLGAALYELWGRGTRQTALIERARACLSHAAAHPAGHLLVRIQAGMRLARVEVEAGDPDAALDAVESTISFIDRLTPGSLARADREYQLGLLSGLPGQAAATALTAGNPGRAVELLELSRGRLAAESLGLSTDDEARLREAAPGLAAEWDRVRYLLSEAETRRGATLLPIEGAPSPTRSSAAAPLNDELAAVLGRIRELPDFREFLRPNLTELALQAEAGPVVFVNADTSRCDALIMTGGSSPVLHVPLPGVTRRALAQHGDSLLRAQRSASDGDASPEERLAAPREILKVLGWMWDNVVDPIMEALGVTASPAGGGAWPRLWWCPIGVAAFLPWHAAGHHEDAHDRPGGRRSVMDRVISSYTPTVQAMASHRRRRRPDTSALPASSALIVTVPDTPGAELPVVKQEGVSLAATLPGAVLLESPTRRRVLEALPRHPITHFSCHGFVDWHQPAQSHLALAHDDAPLTVADVNRLDLHAELAFLSACETTVSALRLADESVHLTGAFHLAGYRHVIGTLWRVDEATAAHLATEFYARLIDVRAAHCDTSRAAEALHECVKALRDAFPAAPTLWAAYTHTGA